MSNPHDKFLKAVVAGQGAPTSVTYFEQQLRSAPVAIDDLYDLVHRWAFETGTHCLFGDDYASESLRQAFATIDRYFPLRVAGVPSPLLPGCDAADARVRDANLCPHNSRSRLIEGREVYLQRAVNDEHRGRMQTAMLWAALANTVPAMFWTLWHLAVDVAAQTRVRAEIRDVLAARSSAQHPGY
jgi:hypothetical protein